MKSRDDKNKYTFTSEQKWAIGIGILPGIPLGGAVGFINMLAVSIKWFMTGEPPHFAKSFARVTVPATATIATCAAFGFFGRKTYLTLKKSIRDENINTFRS